MGLRELEAVVSALLGARAVPVAAALLAAGVVLWLAGARVGRSALTLVGVGAGAYLGLKLPAYMGWGIDGIATAFAGAMLAGLAGWALHTTWIGATLCTMLGLAGAAVAWVTLSDGSSWTLPTIDWSQPHVKILNSIWLSLPGESLSRAMPYAIAGGMITGAAVALAWPKVARVMTWGLTGTAMMTLGGLFLVNRLRPDWLDALPREPGSVAMILGGVALLGMIVQWLMLPSLKCKPVVYNDRRSPADASSGQAPSIEALTRAKAFPAPAAAAGGMRA